MSGTVIVTERMDYDAICAYGRLPLHMQKKVEDFLSLNPKEYLYGTKEVLNAYLVCIGIIGFTDEIYDVARILTQTK